LETPWFTHFIDDQCEFCELDVPVLNGVTSVERLQEVRDAFVQAKEFERFGTLLIELRKAVDSGNEKKMAEIYSSGELQEYSAASSDLRIAASAARVVELTAQFRKLKAKGDRETAIAYWEKHKALLVGRKSTEKLDAVVRNWRRIEKLATDILKHWKPSPDSRTDPALARKWATCRQDIVDHLLVKALVPQIDHRVAQQDAWQTFEGISSKASAELDQQRIDAWKPGLFEDNWPPAENRLDDLAASRKRLRIHIAFNKEASRSGVSRKSETRLAELVVELPSSYLSAPQRSRLKLANMRLAALTAFETQVTGNDERAIVATWTKLDGEGVEFGSAVEQPHRDRKDAATLRAPLVVKLSGIPDGLAMDKRDEWIQKAWDDKILHSCKDPVAVRLRPLFTDAVKRRSLLGDLKRAISAVDDEAVVRIAEDSLLGGFPLGVLPERILEARQNLSTWDEIKTAIDGRDADRFRELFDRRLFRNVRFLEGMRSRREQIKALAAEALVPNKMNGLRAAFFGGITDKGNGALKVEWGWPDRRFSDKCLLCVCSGESPGGSNGSTSQVMFEQTVVREVVENGDGTQPLHKQVDWAGGHVAVCCVLDLGFDELKSEWLNLGQIEG